MRGRGLVLVLLLAAGGCAHYTGGAEPTTPAILEGGGWLRVPVIHVVRQRSPRDCGVAAAAMVVARWRGAPAGRAIVAEHRPGERLRATEVRDLLRDHGLRAYVVEGRHADLEHELARGRPVIVGTIKPWSNGRGYRHYEVVVALRTRDDAVVTIDPAQGWRLSSWDAFEREWAAAAHTTIVALPAP